MIICNNYEQITKVFNEIIAHFPLIKNGVNYWKRDVKLKLLVNGVTKSSVNNVIESSFSRRKKIVRCTFPHEQFKLITEEQVKTLNKLKNSIENGIDNTYRLD